MSKLASLQALLDDWASRAPMPAVAVGIVNADGALAQTTHGTANLETGEAASLAHWWDLASLTKVLVTLPAILDLVDAGSLRLSDELAGVFPKAAGSPYASATIAQLLSYNAGAPQSAELYRIDGSREELIEAALRVPLGRPPGSSALYSDLGMLYLGEVAAELAGAGLNELADRRGWCRYGPITGEAVATERCGWRGRLIVGEVHDENAAALGGTAGHAGTFGTLDMVCAAARAWLTREAASPAAVETATRCWATSAEGERFGLGFRLTWPNGLGGDLAGQHGFGVSGFVGNRLWIEPDRGYAVVILSNRVHPTRGPRDAFNAWCDGLLTQVAVRWPPN